MYNLVDAIKTYSNIPKINIWGSWHSFPLNQDEERSLKRLLHFLKISSKWIKYIPIKYLYKMRQCGDRYRVDLALIHAILSL